MNTVTEVNVLYKTSVQLPYGLNEARTNFGLAAIINGDKKSLSMS